MSAFTYAYARMTRTLVSLGAPTQCLPRVEGGTVIVPWGERVGPFTDERFLLATPAEAESLCITIMTAYTMVMAQRTSQMIAELSTPLQ